jgi:hypothetical protein
MEMAGWIAIAAIVIGVKMALQVYSSSVMAQF